MLPAALIPGGRRASAASLLRCVLGVRDIEVAGIVSCSLPILLRIRSPTCTKSRLSEVMRLVRSTLKASLQTHSILKAVQAGLNAFCFPTCVHPCGHRVPSAADNGEDSWIRLTKQAHMQPTDATKRGDGSWNSRTTPCCMWAVPQCQGHQLIQPHPAVFHSHSLRLVRPSCSFQSC